MSISESENGGPLKLGVAIVLDPKSLDLGYPEYATPGSSGVDLRASNDEPLWLKAGVITLIPTGVKLAIPEGYEAQIRPRSGLALKHGVTLVNSPGTIDADYRGEIGVIATTLKAEPFLVERGMRIAQMVFVPIVQVRFDACDELPETSRGAGGFGHTGTGSL